MAMEQQHPNYTQVLTVSDVLARETGSVLITVHVLSGGTYTRALTLPPQDGELDELTRQ